MTLNRSALVAAIATTVLWAAKAVAIDLAGGLGRSPAEGPLFLLGLAACVATGLLLSVAVARPRSVAGRVLAGVVGFVVVSAYGVLEAAVIAALQPVHPGWVWSELNLWVLALTLLAAAFAVDARDRTPRRSPAPVDATA